MAVIVGALNELRIFENNKVSAKRINEVFAHFFETVVDKVNPLPGQEGEICVSYYNTMKNA